MQRTFTTTVHDHFQYNGRCKQVLMLTCLYTPHTYKQVPIKLFHNIALFYICLFLCNKKSLTNCLIWNQVLCNKFTNFITIYFQFRKIQSGHRSFPWTVWRQCSSFSNPWHMSLIMFIMSFNYQYSCKRMASWGKCMVVCWQGSMPVHLWVFFPWHKYGILMKHVLVFLLPYYQFISHSEQTHRGKVM